MLRGPPGYTGYDVWGWGQHEKEPEDSQGRLFEADSEQQLLKP